MSKLIFNEFFNASHLNFWRRVTKGDITVNFYTKDAVDINGNYIPQQLVYQSVAASQIRAMMGQRLKKIQ